MSQEEAKRFKVISLTLEGYMSVGEAAMHLGLSRRQVKRLKKGVVLHGPTAVAHKNRGRQPANRIPGEIRDAMVSLASSDDFRDINYAHFRDLLEEREGIVVSVSSAARILKSAGIISGKTHRPRKHFCTRERRAQKGALVQIDASPHAWLEDRGPAMTLVGIIDDATGAVFGATFQNVEDMNGYFIVLKQMISRYGVPLSLYSDRHTIFVSPASERMTLEDELAGKTKPLSQVGRALEDLGITHLKARTPQAKGRIERLWQTLQDRLIIEMRLAGISTREDANVFLKRYIEKHNRQFGVEPREKSTAFCPAPPRETLERILSCQETRKASGGSTISYESNTYHLINAKGMVTPLTPGSVITVHTMPDGAVKASYSGKLYGLQVCHVAKPQAKQSPACSTPKARKTPAPPPSDHPWRRSVINPQSSIRYRQRGPG